MIQVSRIHFYISHIRETRSCSSRFGVKDLRRPSAHDTKSWRMRVASNKRSCWRQQVDVCLDRVSQVYLAQATTANTGFGNGVHCFPRSEAFDASKVVHLWACGLDSYSEGIETMVCMTKDSSSSHQSSRFVSQIVRCRGRDLGIRSQSRNVSLNLINILGTDSGRRCIRARGQIGRFL